MCNAMEHMCNQTLKEGMEKVALRLLKKGGMPLEEIAECCDLCVERVQELAEDLTA